jgi:DNA-binding GntR family transcriptional regulator
MQPPSSQRETAYRSLRRMLILQQLPSGERLREPEWARQLGVHRTALREAFARLHAEGMLERGPTTGYFVPEVTLEDLNEIMKIRLALECLAIEQIGEVDQKTLESFASALERTCAQLEQFIADQYPLGVIEADRRFHETLIDAAGMKRLSLVYQRAPLPMVHRQVIKEADWRQRCGVTLDEHRRIVQALRRGNRSEAQSILRTHLSRRGLMPICH